MATGHHTNPYIYCMLPLSIAKWFIVSRQSERLDGRIRFHKPVGLWVVMETEAGRPLRSHEVHRYIEGMWSKWDMGWNWSSQVKAWHAHIFILQSSSLLHFITIISLSLRLLKQVSLCQVVYILLNKPFDLTLLSDPLPSPLSPFHHSQAI